MALFNLHLQFNYKVYTFFLNSIMSSNDIKHTVAELFQISEDTFDIQLYDESFKNNFVLDDEFVERLHERLPRTMISTLRGDILLNSSSTGKLKLESCGTVQNLEKSRLSRPVGQTRLYRKIFVTGHSGSGQYRYINI